MASIAVFIALGGGAYAAVQVNGKNIKPRSIAGKKLKNNTLGGKQINEGKLGTVPKAQQAHSATRADTATTASSATRADTATTASTATRATTADTATTATNATSAANADNATTLAGAPPSAYLVSCPATTTLYGGVCWDNASRTAAGWIAASDTCGNAGGRLPTLSELIAYTNQPGGQIAANHWSSEVVDVISSSNLVFGFRNETTTGFGTDTDMAYRCVFYRTN
jgi:cytoskeletal protein RodZ